MKPERRSVRQRAGPRKVHMIKSLARPLLLVVLFVAAVPATQAKESKTKASSPAVVSSGTVTLSKKEDGPAMTGFSASDPAIYATNKGEKMKKGDKVRFVWIIEDGGKKIKPDSKVSEYTATANGYDNGKEFSHLDKPAAGWPLGKWRVDVYVNDAKATSAKFAIK